MKQLRLMMRVGLASALIVLMFSTYRYGLATEPGQGTASSPAMGATPTGTLISTAPVESGNGDVNRRATSTRPATQPASRPASTRPATSVKSEVVAYYFHRTVRCPSCLHIEATAKRIIENQFTGEMDVGLLQWKSVDMQQPGNEHYEREYSLSAPSLVLVKTVDGRRVAWKNLEEVWDLHRDEAAFGEYVSQGVKSMLLAKTPDTRPARLSAPALHDLHQAPR